MRRVPAFAMAAVALFAATASPALAEPLSPPATNSQAEIGAVLSRALSQRGVPYVYGGGNSEGPTSNPKGTGVAGFDASGLMVYAYAAAGVKLPRTSADQYKSGRKVPPPQALPGDLICYGPEGSESVAMFIGNGQMVEATTPAVTISPIRAEGLTPYAIRVIG